jgi:hypothetical protein
MHLYEASMACLASSCSVAVLGTRRLFGTDWQLHHVDSVMLQDSSYHSVTVYHDAFSLSCRCSRTLCSGQRGLQEGATSR